MKTSIKTLLGILILLWLGAYFFTKPNAEDVTPTYTIQGEQKSIDLPVTEWPCVTPDCKG